MANLELYKIFLVVAKEENITRASEILDISQPAVTKHIKNLESLLNKKLFVRTNKGLWLTEIGEILYKQLEKPMNEIIAIDAKYNETRNVNIGSHNHLLNKVFGKCINEYYLKYENINLNIKNFETDIMINMLKNYELDIVFSKKVDNINFKNLKFIKLGYLHDIFIVGKDSKYKGTLIKEDLKNEIIYVPRTYAQTVKRLKDLMNENNLKLKNSSYNTILELVSKTDAIGFITKEYIEKEKFEKFNLREIELENKLEPVEFGIYLNDNKFIELKNLIEIIKNKLLK